MFKQKFAKKLSKMNKFSRMENGRWPKIILYVDKGLKTEFFTQLVDVMDTKCEGIVSAKEASICFCYQEEITEYVYKKFFDDREKRAEEDLYNPLSLGFPRPDYAKWIAFVTPVRQYPGRGDPRSLRWKHCRIKADKGLEVIDSFTIVLDFPIWGGCDAEDTTANRIKCLLDKTGVSYDWSTKDAIGNAVIAFDERGMTDQQKITFPGLDDWWRHLGKWAFWLKIQKDDHYIYEGNAIQLFKFPVTEEIPLSVRIPSEKEARYFYLFCYYQPTPTQKDFIQYQIGKFKNIPLSGGSVGSLNSLEKIFMDWDKEVHYVFLEVHPRN